jgi:hypothetical protein
VSAQHERVGRNRVRIPADVEREDRVLAGLTARQLAVLATGAVVLWVAYITLHRVVPLAAFGAFAVPVAGVVAFAALGRIEGIPIDRLVGAVVRFLRAPRRLVPAPDGVPRVPTWAGVVANDVPAPLRMPLRGVADDGTIDLGVDGFALVAKAASVAFSLRTEREQEALVAAFARFLNSLSEPIELVCRAEPVDLGPAIAALLESAPALPHPGLETAARDHACFLGELADRRDLLRREVLLVLRQPRADGAVSRLRRRGEESVAALAAVGVEVRILDGPAARAALLRTLDPSDPARARGVGDPGGVITVKAKEALR